MTMTLAQTKTAMGPGLTASFLASGGTGAVTYAVTAGGAGGTIGASTGIYTAPTTVSADPKLWDDTITATDTVAATATATIRVGNPLILFCDILQTGLALANGKVFLWDQKIFKPTSDGIFIAVSVPDVKAIGNNIRPLESDSTKSEQYVTVSAQVDINVMSRDNSALFRKEEVFLALRSDYSERQQVANSFSISRISNGFKDVSGIDGPAIPYRFHASFRMIYTVSKTQSVDYFDTFEDVVVVANP